MSSHSHAPEPIPPILLVGAAAIIMITVLGTAFARFTEIGTQERAETAITQSVMLRFTDEADGGVSVYNHDSGALIWHYPPETGGFVRTAMRAVVHSRKVAGIGPEAPFQLARTEEGRLLLTDPVTDLTVGLEAFGADNVRDFAQILDNKDANG